jgi:hypothetical protein
MPDDVAPSNVNRSVSLAGTSIAIFTFMLTFLYPRFATGEVNDLLFQGALVVMGIATFSFVLATLCYYGTSLGPRVGDDERTVLLRRADWFWTLGYTLLFLDPALILFSVGLLAVAITWLALWVLYIAFAIRYLPQFRPARNLPGDTPGNAK